MDYPSSPVLGDLWNRYPLESGVAAALLVALALGLATASVARFGRGRRGEPRDFKAGIANVVVQAGVTVFVVTGTHAYGVNVLHAPAWEAIGLALVLEAALWVTIGKIRRHGSQPGSTGFGPAGPYFYLTATIGGVLAVIGGDTLGAQIGRGAVVAVGVILWYLTLLEYTNPAAGPSRFRWTPRRLLVAMGALEPADTDVADQHREWQIRRMARAMRLANSRGPIRAMGRRALIARAEQADETVIAEARRRYAVAHVLVDTVKPDSEVMAGVIASVKAELLPPSPVPATAAVVEAPVPAAPPAPAAPRRLSVARSSGGRSRSGEKTERADAFILAEWAAGRRPSGPDVDTAVDAASGSGLGRQRLRKMRELHPEREPVSGTDRGGSGSPGDSGTATAGSRSNGYAVPELVATAGQR